MIPESGLYHSAERRSFVAVVAFPNAPGISRILLDPADPKHIVVAVLGDVFAPSAQRGVYVSFDGGATFSKTLYLSDQSGASDMAMDPKNPSVIYAGMWHVLRRPWAITSGGTGDDGLYRSSDGGRTWKEVTGNGFPGSADRPHRRGDRTVAAESHLRARRVGRRHSVALRRLGRHVEDGQQRLAGKSAPVLFLARACLADRPRVPSMP